MGAPEVMLAREAPLVRKLGIEAGHRILLLSPPDGYYARLGALPPGALVNVGAQAEFDVIQVFVRTRAELEEQLPIALAALKPGGRLWFAYPVTGPGGMAGFSPGPGWQSLIRAGFRPVADIAIDHSWSAMRFAPVQPPPAG
jgi:hypothetical protein